MFLGHLRKLRRQTVSNNVEETKLCA